ncbi:high light inducible protein [Prochlorococcus sp. MIT 1300]|uniref:high light inducible protein n=1 Tax=Prochlorococcus sp. MIT 1300 TaxID=3096218 RepID=UPI002A759267|nr:high light inducible protein [Prochlorococcus sp. MIT 1300]
MDSETPIHTSQLGKPVSSGELNSWRRGFTPQAEIWNGRMAMFGLAVGLCFLFTWRLFFS